MATFFILEILEINLRNICIKFIYLPEPIDAAQDVGEQRSRDRDLGKLEGDIAPVPDRLGADLDQLVAQRG